MTNQKKLEAIRAVIIKAVLEINLCPNNDCQEGHMPEQYYNCNGEIDVDWGGCDFCVVNGEYKPQYRPISLQDLLLTINNIDNGDDYAMGTTGEILEYCLYPSDDEPTYHGTDKFYNLSLSFEENMKDEKLLDFIYEILK